MNNLTHVSIACCIFCAGDVAAAFQGAEVVL